MTPNATSHRKQKRTAAASRVAHALRTIESSTANFHVLDQALGDEWRRIEDPQGVPDSRWKIPPVLFSSLPDHLGIVRGEVTPWPLQRAGKVIELVKARTSCSLPRVHLA